VSGDFAQLQAKVCVLSTVKVDWVSSEVLSWWLILIVDLIASRDPTQTSGCVRAFPETIGVGDRNWGDEPPWMWVALSNKLGAWVDQKQKTETYQWNLWNPEPKQTCPPLSCFSQIICLSDEKLMKVSDCIFQPRVFSPCDQFPQGNSTVSRGVSTM
jgi:hypothetical protein